MFPWKATRLTGPPSLMCKATLATLPAGMPPKNALLPDEHFAPSFRNTVIPSLFRQKITWNYTMIFYTVPSPPQLSQYVRFFWLMEGQKSDTFPFVHRATAETCQELIFYYRGEVKTFKSETKAEQPFRSGLYAQSHSFRKFLIEKEFGMLGVYLYPHASPLLFNLPAQEVSGLNLDSSIVFGKEGEILEDQVFCAKTNVKRIELVSLFLKRRLSMPSPRSLFLSASIRRAIVSGTITSIKELAAKSNLSVRQLERDFKVLSGFTPRLFSNLVRFRSLMEVVSTNPISMTELAYKYNYYDQSHFINEFKRFTGLTPTQYLKGTTFQVNERLTPETAV